LCGGDGVTPRPPSHPILDRAADFGLTIVDAASGADPSSHPAPVLLPATAAVDDFIVVFFVVVVVVVIVVIVGENEERMRRRPVRKLIVDVIKC
jgi:hypothetical protein